MARRRRQRSSEYVRPQREVQIFSSPLLRSTPYSALDEVEDLREFDPEGRHQAAPLTVFGGRSRVQVPQGRTYDPYVMSRLQFVAPDRVAVCVRRKQRREVLFAKRKTRGGGRRRPRRTWRSEIGC